MHCTSSLQFSCLHMTLKLLVICCSLDANNKPCEVWFILEKLGQYLQAPWNLLNFAGLRMDFGLILLISDMIIHRSFTGPTHFSSVNVWGLVSFVVSGIMPTGPWFNIKMLSYQYRKSHCGDKTILRPSYLHNVFSYTGKMTSLYWIGALTPSAATSSLSSHYIDCKIVGPYLPQGGLSSTSIEVQIKYISSNNSVS